MGFSQNLAQLETSPYYKRRKLRLREVSNFFIIAHLVPDGTLRTTPDRLTAGVRVLSHNRKHLHSTPHVQELTNTQSSEQPYAARIIIPLFYI